MVVPAAGRLCTMLDREEPASGRHYPGEFCEEPASGRHYPGGFCGEPASGRHYPGGILRGAGQRPALPICQLPPSVGSGAGTFSRPPEAT